MPDARKALTEQALNFSQFLFHLCIHHSLSSSKSSIGTDFRLSRGITTSLVLSSFCLMTPSKSMQSLPQRFRLTVRGKSSSSLSRLSKDRDFWKSSTNDLGSKIAMFCVVNVRYGGWLFEKMCDVLRCFDFYVSTTPTCCQLVYETIFLIGKIKLMIIDLTFAGWETLNVTCFFIGWLLVYLFAYYKIENQSNTILLQYS